MAIGTKIPNKPPEQANAEPTDTDRQADETTPESKSCTVRTRKPAKILCFNVNGFRARMRDGTLARLLREENADIVGLTEMKCQARHVDKDQEWASLCTELGYTHSRGHYSQTWTSLEGNMGY